MEWWIPSHFGLASRFDLSFNLGLIPIGETPVLIGPGISGSVKPGVLFNWKSGQLAIFADISLGPQVGLSGAGFSDSGGGLLGFGSSDLEPIVTGLSQSGSVEAFAWLGAVGEVSAPLEASPAQVLGSVKGLEVEQLLRQLTTFYVDPESQQIPATGYFGFGFGGGIPYGGVVNAGVSPSLSLSLSKIYDLY